MRNIRKENIVFYKNKLSSEQKVKVDEKFQHGMSFFINIKTGYRPQENYYHTVFEEPEGKIRFMLHEHSDLRMYWGSNNLLWKKSVDSVHENYFKWGEWNQIGFVYMQGILTTYINGKVLWVKRLDNKNPSINDILLFPDEINKGFGKKFIGNGGRTLLMKRALSNKDIAKLYKNMNVNNLSLLLIIIILFILLNLLSYSFLSYLKKVFSSIKKDGMLRVKHSIYRISLLFSLNLLFFVIFNLGYSAAKYIHSMDKFSKTSIYFFILNSLFLTFVFSVFLEKIIKIKFSKCILLSFNILLLLTITSIFSTLPRFIDIFPFTFNLLFSLLYTLIIGSYEILYLSHLAEAN